MIKNRKLRHLQGISLRNLALSPPRPRSRGKTIDDESLPYALKTPAKALAQRETHKLEHSRSSNDLKSSPSKSSGALKTENSDSDAPAKLRPRKPRRRSTLNWSNAPPRVRQNKLECVARERMADTWFSLHCSGLEEPIYVSEVIEKAMNPSFRFFDLSIYGPSVTRQDGTTIQFWVRTENMPDYIPLVELQLYLRSLQFIGKSLDSFHHPLPQNCILLHLSDGIYTSFTDLPLDEPVLAAPVHSKQALELQLTSSFDALMRLSNLDDCIQDALATRETLTTQISSLLEEQKQSLGAINASSQAEQSLASTNRSIATSRKLLKSTQSRRAELLSSLETRRNAMTSGNVEKEKEQTSLDSIQANVTHRKTLLKTTKSEITGQTRRICEDLLAIYPIESFEQKPLSFKIGSLYLPNAASASASEADPATTAAALGHVAHIVHLLSFYLLTPIPYPPSPHGSTSTIFDPISTNMPSIAARTFPLYQKGAVTYRFEYGVFLLNSDVELLMSRQGSRMVDLRHTLPNLKYLLTVLTTGKGEPLARKKGGLNALEDGNAINGQKMSIEQKDSEKGSFANGKLSESRSTNTPSV